MSANGHLRVLVIGDRPADTSPLADALGRDGCRVIVSPDGPAAVEASRQARPDVVVLAADPTDGDYPVAHAILESAGWRKPFVVALADRAENGAFDRSRAAGVHLYVAKPVDSALLLGVVRRFRDLLAGVEGFDPVI